MHLFKTIALLLALSVGLLAAAKHFQTEKEARQYCPNDTVVWVNSKTGIYHFKGQRWYGTTKSGWYECKKEADSEGDRSTQNGQ